MNQVHLGNSIMGIEYFGSIFILLLLSGHSFAQGDTLTFKHDSVYHYEYDFPKLEKIWLDNIYKVCHKYANSGYADFCNKIDFKKIAKERAKAIRVEELNVITFFERLDTSRSYIRANQKLIAKRIDQLTRYKFRRYIYENTDILFPKIEKLVAANLTFDASLFDLPDSVKMNLVSNSSSWIGRSNNIQMFKSRLGQGGGEDSLIESVYKKLEVYERRKPIQITDESVLWGLLDRLVYLDTPKSWKAIFDLKQKEAYFKIGTCCNHHGPDLPAYASMTYLIQITPFNEEVTFYLDVLKKIKPSIVPNVEMRDLIFMRLLELHYEKRLGVKLHFKSKFHYSDSWDDLYNSTSSIAFKEAPDSLIEFKRLFKLAFELMLEYETIEDLSRGIFEPSID